MRPSVRTRLASTFLLSAILGLVSIAECHAQRFSFVGLAWGDSYETVNTKLAKAGFSNLIELEIHKREPPAPVKFRLFDGTLLGNRAEGTAWLENDRLIGVKVDLKTHGTNLDTLYRDVTANIKTKYGRENIGLSKQKAEWGADDGESLTVLAAPTRGEVSVFYKSDRWKHLEKTDKAKEASKF